MIVSEIIRKKREGGVLSNEEVTFMVNGAATGSVADYQLSAWLMTIFFKGMNFEETFTLMKAMKDSGDSYQWKKLNPKLREFHLVDKHSTGGVGDKPSLIIVPLAIELGLKVPMISGRGLGHTGGTVDKLLSIPGFKMDFAPEVAAKLLFEVGACLLSQTDRLCPADKKLYHLRDVTATVESFPLISGSIVSKKWAGGCESLVYDVKYGEGAFMATQALAEELGNWLLGISKLANLKAEAVLSRMEEPLGTCIGNALEVRESVWILKNEFPTPAHKQLAEPLRRLSCQLTARMALLAGIRSDYESTLTECLKILDSGKAFAHFDKMILAQGGNRDWYSTLPQTNKFQISAPENGTVADIKSRDLGVLGLEIGIGRIKVDDKVKNDVGFELAVGVGTKVAKGDPIAHLHLSEKPSSDFEKRFLNCFIINNDKVNVGKGDLVWKILQQK